MSFRMAAALRTSPRVVSNFFSSFFLRRIAVYIPPGSRFSRTSEMRWAVKTHNPRHDEKNLKYPIGCLMFGNHGFKDLNLRRIEVFLHICVSQKKKKFFLSTGYRNASVSDAILTTIRTCRSAGHRAGSVVSEDPRIHSGSRYRSHHEPSVIPGKTHSCEIRSRARIPNNVISSPC